MSLKYYVLASKNNFILIDYQNKYYNLILDKLDYINSIKSINVINYRDIVYKDFLLFPDIQSLINSIFIDLINNNDSKNLNILLDNFINFNNFFKNDKFKKIPLTNIYLSDFDLNPFNKFDAHPDHKNTGGIIWFWEKKIDIWLDVYSKTFELLKKIDLWFYNELNFIIKKITPFWTAYNLHNSASYKECIWNLYLWITLWVESPEIFNLEAIIHESSHNKLNLIMHFDNLILNEKKEIYYSSIRPDARPLVWIFLWLHAFVPTMYILTKWYNIWVIKSDILIDKIALYYIKTKLLYNVLNKYAKFSNIWKEVFEEIKYCLNLLEFEIKKINIPKSTLENAKKQQNIHFQDVCKNYPYLIY